MKRFLSTTLLSLSCYVISAQMYLDVSAFNDISEGAGPAEWGCGVSFVDFNGDGWDDLTFGSTLGEDINFYQNVNGTFTKIDPLVEVTCESKQILWVDYDNDYDRDLFITCYQAPNRLFRNDGGLNFTDVTISSGIPDKNDPSFGASFGDYDRDGDLDLYVCNYTFGIIHSSYLLRNEGDGTFTNVTQSTGVYAPPNFSFQSMFFDHNNDLWPDLYIAVDMAYNNLLFHNNGYNFTNGAVGFTDLTYTSGAGIIVDAMNSGAGDYDNDGDLDIYVSNTSPAPGNILLRNEGDMTYSSVGAECGVDFFVTSWASNFADVNNDTYLDLYVSTLAPDTTNNGLFINNGTCPFTFYNGNFSGNAYASFSHAFGDFNQDGKPDLAVSQVSPHNYLLLKNEHASTSNSNWLKVKLQGENSNTDGIGSWIEVHDNGNKYVRFTHCGEGFMNQNSMSTHFGLGSITQIDSLVVRWPSGTVDKLIDVNVNQCLSILENSFAPLPVSLHSFTAKNRDNRYTAVQWSTETESNSKHYEIQRSVDGRNFTTIGLVSAKVNSTEHQSYEYFDQQIDGALTYYYRLKMVDQDERFDYSNTIVVHFTRSQPLHLAALRPNPVRHNQVMIDLELSHPQNFYLQLFNSLGQAILRQETELKEGFHQIPLNVQSLDNGLYLVVIESEYGKQFERLVVSR